MTADDFHEARAWFLKYEELQDAVTRATEACTAHERTCKHLITDSGTDPATGKHETWCHFCRKEM